MNAALVQSLEQTGIHVTPYFWQKSAIQLGYRMEVDGMELVFRVEEGEIIIVLLKRVSPNLGLSNPFSCLFLLAEHAISLFPSDWVIRGNVDVLRGSNMSSQRLAQFYLRACGASHDQQADWYFLRLADYRPLKKRKM
ncbi:LcrR family type III secretion system chaperone VcrR [Vibrio parahaemolyticus]|uniref:LcrR family type III secretion system chaperone VcrR n=1 Tax=Vibrio parahaemolyticus TaxID=670 RepID=UPI00215C0FF0|nr:LcrR family type III secretion system chaperone VcrR [Vibrio parahaemolyticus]EKO4254211.1 LcrR family type III secretion system chaperone VcrR [Vibrio parahaemolyticus]ELB2918926.1 LcrR family type III secretion system chaperone VcrR [Vibrio parahaemolyticus]MCR9852986.1 LcrR family type III secretion system chaperone VcrR [Vibrio parahaemolyticus]HCE2999662.1 LcrR family type III secretion system chaperone VcrR [Vibrio parahaemolyticus]HCE3065655.1 LcrR family type III secretion system ch